MFRHAIALGALGALCVLFASPVNAADTASPPTAPTEAAVVTGKIISAGPAGARDGEPSKRPVYGPIRSRDPLVRAQIKRLYLEQHDLFETLQAELSRLAAALRAQSDPDFRAQINREVAQAKLDFQLRHMEIGLEIARLNEDERRVAEFELALDQVRHPEKYRPEPPARSARAERRDR
jgi:hypothetical protein